MTYIRLLSFILIATLVMGCSKDEREEFKEELKEFLMTKEEKEKRARKEQEYLEKIKQEVLDTNRKEIIYDRANFEIKKAISEHLKKHNWRYSEIIVYNIYTHNNDRKRMMYNYYKVDFSADIIGNPDIFTKRTDTITGYINFLFFLDEKNYKIDGISWEVSKGNQIEFSDEAKDAAKFLFDKFTESN